MKKTLLRCGLAAFTTSALHIDKVDTGAHFAACVQPELFVTEIRATFRSLR
jgi:hypothetical protein